MNPSKSNWIPKYYEVLERQKALTPELPKSFPSWDRDRTFYHQLQPTGIIYGFPMQMLYLDNKYLKGWSEEEALKVLLLEGFIFTERLFGRTGEINSEFVNDIANFYDKSRLVPNPKIRLNLFGKKDPIQKLENILSHRVDLKLNFDNKLWISYLYNSLLFHDLILFFKLQSGFSEDLLLSRRNNVIEALLQTMSAAAHADGKITEKEKNLFDIFLASANLSDEKVKELRRFFKSGKGISDIDFSVVDTWLLKRYFVEIALLTVWSDQEKNPGEEFFLSNLLVKLGIDEQTFEESHVTVDSFVFNNYDRLPYLKDGSDVQRIYGNLSNRYKRILERNKKKLAKELRESKELVQLIKLNSKRDLTPEEKEKLRLQMKDLARAIPALTIFMLPGGTVLLPLVLKLIPNLVPTAFRDNQIGTNEE